MKRCFYACQDVSAASCVGDPSWPCSVCSATNCHSRCGVGAVHAKRPTKLLTPKPRFDCFLATAVAASTASPSTRTRQPSSARPVHLHRVRHDLTRLTIGYLITMKTPFCPSLLSGVFRCSQQVNELLPGCSIGCWQLGDEIIVQNSLRVHNKAFRGSEPSWQCLFGVRSKLCPCLFPVEIWVFAPAAPRSHDIA
jgi:hypothetical protein